MQLKNPLLISLKMKFGDRMLVVETKLKIMEKQLWVLIVIVLGQIGIQVL